mmetsp:Transcript_18371/g.23897  ORF Transcript_18371/g.23897 Transcript_18371/m.23897 type:complete len:518 (-) Transcript_18371:2978-4531(-)
MEEVDEVASQEVDETERAVPVYAQYKRPGVEEYGLFVHVENPHLIWNRSNVGDRSEYYKLEARLFRLIKVTGTWLQPTQEQIQEHNLDSEARRVWERQNQRAITLENAGISFSDAIAHWIWMECFTLKYHPDNLFAKKILQWQNLEGEFDEAVPVTIIGSMINCIMRQRGVCEEGSIIPGLGNQYPSVKKFLCAIAKVHSVLGVKADPTKEFRITSQVKVWRDNHRTNYHRGFDAFEGLRQIYTAIMTMPGWSEMLKVQVMAMHLYCFWHGHRVSECAQYCLLMNDISLPRHKSSFDSEGMPKFINVIYRDWKQRKKAEKGDPYQQQFHRNPFDSRADSVLWLSFWMALGGHTPNTGPLFGPLLPKRQGGGMRKAHHVKKDENGIDIWYTANNQRVNYTDQQVRNIFTKIIQRCDQMYPYQQEGDEMWSLIKPHDWRVSFVAWVARCKGDEVYARTGARFAQSSTDFYTYWNQGAIKREEFVNEKIEDPIWNFCPFPPQGVTYSGSRLSRMAGSHRR